ncbi:MAG TPA: RNA polymerase sigma-54 factor, partial [Terriglobia bacterium]|nr:RNA polymerase sigma-54 factor [Terriglobia bacterium]
MAFLEHKLNVNLRQTQTLTPAMAQMVKLLHLNKLELTDVIQQELMENPVLEEGTEVVERSDDAPEFEPDGEPQLSANGKEAADEGDLQYAAVSEREVTVEQTADTLPAEPEPVEDSYDDIDYQSFDAYLNNTASRPRESEVFDKPSFENFLAKPSTLTDHLEWQLGMAPMTEPVRLACHSIVGNLNEDGYLMAVDESGREIPITLEEIAETGGHSLEDVEAALRVVQRLDPPGIGARDLSECLALQLLALGEDESIAAEIVRSHLHKLQNKQFKEVAKALGQPVEVIHEEYEIIKSLDPRPGQKYNRIQPRTIEPDVFIVKVDAEGYRVVANEDEVPQLRLSSRYRRMLDGNGLDKEAKNYVRDRFKSAMQLLKNIEQRKRIIVKVCEAIIRRQTEFLDGGIDNLKPMMIKDVAEEVGVHPSTVSRAVANKFAH